MAAADTTTTVRRALRPAPQITAHHVEREPTGWASWVTTTDHKRIGIMYLVMTFVFFMLGGVEALLMRLQLGQADNTLLSPADVQRAVHDARDDDDLPVRRADHGPGFGNYFVPLMIGARDMAFPKLNALSFWLLRSPAASSSTPRCSSARRSAAGRAYTPLLDGRVLAQRRRRRVDLPRPPHRHLARSSARSTSTRRSPTCARPAWAGAACRCSSGRSSSTRSC